MAPCLRLSNSSEMRGVLWGRGGKLWGVVKGRETAPGHLDLGVFYYHLSGALREPCERAVRAGRGCGKQRWDLEAESRSGEAARS